MKDSKTELLRDLCARLLDHVIVNYRGSKVDLTEYARSVKLECCKPYLRPMSSMTEEEAREIGALHDIKNILSVKVTDKYIDYMVDDGSLIITLLHNELISSVKCFDWLNSKHFDFRGLIPKGLAIEALENMYNIKKK